MELKIELDVEEIERRIIDAAAEKMLCRFRDEAAERLAQRIDDLRDDKIMEELSPMITAALSEPIQRTNRHGEIQGDPRTLIELITETIQAQLKMPKPRGQWNRTENALSKFVEEATSYELEKDLRIEFDAAKATVKKAVHQKGAEMLSEMVEKLSK